MPHKNGVSRKCSIDAFKRAGKDTNAKALLAIYEKAGPGGLTDDQIESFGMIHRNSNRATRLALMAKGLVVRVPDPAAEGGIKKGRTVSGRDAVFHALAKFHPDALDDMQVSTVKLSELGYRSYEEYCRGPEMAALKDRKIKAEGGAVCGMSGVPCKDVHLHHLNYRRIGKERLSDVMLVSPAWHEVLETIHQRKSSRDGSVERKLRRLVQEAKRRSAVAA